MKLKTIIVILSIFGLFSCNDSSNLQEYDLSKYGINLQLNLPKDATFTPNKFMDNDLAVSSTEFQVNIVPMKQLDGLTEEQCVAKAKNIDTAGGTIQYKILKETKDGILYWVNIDKVMEETNFDVFYKTTDNKIYKATFETSYLSELKGKSDADKKNLLENAFDILTIQQK